jgi:hypothetical protein
MEGIYFLYILAVFERNAYILAFALTIVQNQPSGRRRMCVTYDTGGMPVFSRSLAVLPRRAVSAWCHLPLPKKDITSYSRMSLFLFTAAYHVRQTTFPYLRAASHSLRLPLLSLACSVYSCGNSTVTTNLVL